IEPILIALLMVQLISFSNGSYVRWIDSPLMRFLGRISYSLYLYQQLTLDFAHKLFADQPMIVRFPVAVAVTVMVASISYYVIERPFLKLKDARSGRSARVRSPARIGAKCDRKTIDAPSPQTIEIEGQ